MALNNAGDVVLRLRKLESTMSPAEIKKRLTKVGVALKPIGLGGAASTKVGGDLMMTRGWSRPGPLELAFKVTDDALIMHRARRSAGPWRVAEEGRNQGNAGGLAGPGIIRSGDAAGTTARTKSGAVRKVRAFKSRRWNGATSGFGTWTAAGKAMGAQAPKIVTKLTRADVAKAFRG